MSKNTGTDRTNPLDINDMPQRFSPSSPTKSLTTRSAAPESIRHLPMIAAMAMTTPILPAVVPNSVATRLIFSENSPGASRLTTIAAVIRARNALTRRATIIPMTMATPMARMTRGPATLISPGAWVARMVERFSPFKFLPSMNQQAFTNGPVPVVGGHSLAGEAENFQ